MAAHARLKNEFTEDEKYHNLMSWLVYAYWDTDARNKELWWSYTIPAAHESKARCDLQTWLLASFGPRQAYLVFIAYARSEGSGEPAHSRSLARTSAARSYKQWVKRNLQTES